MYLSRDINGNKTLVIQGTDVAMPYTRGFSIQTLGNLPVTHKHYLHGSKRTLNGSYYLVAMSEVKAYITAHGTNSQKLKLGITL